MALEHDFSHDVCVADFTLEDLHHSRRERGRHVHFVHAEEPDVFSHYAVVMSHCKDLGLLIGSRVMIWDSQSLRRMHGR